MKSSRGLTTPVLVLTLFSTLLLFLIFGQGIYLFRLERQYAAAQQQLESMERVMRISQDLLKHESRIPYELAEWEQLQSDPEIVPIGLRSSYHSWNTVRMAGVMRAHNVLDQLLQELSPESRTADVTRELKLLVKDLEYRYKRRLRPDIRAQVESE